MNDHTHTHTHTHLKSSKVYREDSGKEEELKISITQQSYQTYYTELLKVRKENRERGGRREGGIERGREGGRERERRDLQ